MLPTTKAIGITALLATPVSVRLRITMPMQPTMVNIKPKRCSPSWTTEGNIRPLITGLRVKAISINITTTMRGVKSLCILRITPPRLISATITPPTAIDEYMAFTSAPALNEDNTPTRSTDAGPTTIGILCPHNICTSPVTPIMANSFCEYRSFSAGEPCATKTLVATTATARINHCKA